MSDARQPTQPTSATPQSNGKDQSHAAPRWVSYGLVATAALACLVALAARRRPATAAPHAVPQGPAKAPSTTVATPPATPPKSSEDERTAIAAPPPKRPQVEMVFVLDTTGSMSGLIEGAKRKIWSLASYVAQGQPTPDLRVGLIAYRDVGDEYVTRRFDLDGDLDRVYRRLRTFHADGGGDTPEHVSRALDEAVHKMRWTDRQEVVKVIYLVGDAPPHTDYTDGYDFGRAARTATNKGIQVHTIRCGTSPDTQQVWKRIAALGGGEYMTVSQDGGMREERSPYDAELARLHDRLSESTLAYGRHREAVRSAVSAAASAPAEVKAERGRFMAKNARALAGEGDLVDDLTSGAVKLEALPNEALPAELQALSPSAQRARIAATQAERDDLRRQIDDLTKKRDAHLAKQAKDEAGARADGFDAAAKRALKKSVDGNAMAGFKL